MEFGTDLLLHGIAYTCRFRLTPIGARTNDNDFVFAIPKMYHNPVMHNGSPRCRWQTYTCVGSGICCRENFPKFLTWAEPDPKRRFFRYTACRKSFTTNQWCRWKEYTPKVRLFGSQTTRHQEPHMRQPQTHEKLWVQKFI